MGNQQSQTKDTTAQLWSCWTLTEKEALEKIFETADTTLPVYFSKDLQACISSYLKDKDISEYLVFAKQIIKSKDTSTIFKVFQYAVEKKEISLETFVLWITTSGVPLWYESGSGYTYSDSKKNEKSLVHYLLNNASDLEQQKNDDMAWLNEDDDTNKINKETWQQRAVVSPSTISQVEFMHWINSTPAFIGLFQLSIEYLLLGKCCQEKDLHKRRLDHTASPQLQQHHDETIKLFGKDKFSSLLNPFDYFLLTLYLPLNALSWSEYERNQRNVNQDVQHELLFSSRRDGMSWQNFVSRMIGKGSTITIIKAKDGSLFGGYADDAWENARTDWYGNSSNFLFRLSEKYGAWIGTSSNNHYQYLCWGKKSLPNGFGMGGQFDYSGLWIDADFIHGHSRAGPLCTTYSSPQLSKAETFIVDEVEVWLVRPLQKNEDDDDETSNGGVLSHAQEMEFMEMAGKKMYSKDLGPDLSGKDKA